MHVLYTRLSSKVDVLVQLLLLSLYKLRSFVDDFGCENAESFFATYIRTGSWSIGQMGHHKLMGHGVSGC